MAWQARPDERISLERLRLRLTGSVQASLGLAEAREATDMLVDQTDLFGDVTFSSDRLGGLAAEWSAAPGVSQDHVILFLHGGAFMVGSIVSHRPMAVKLGREAGAMAVAVEYRLTPEHAFPAQMEDGLAAYRALLDRFLPGCIAIAGDSAGANLAITVLLAARDTGLPMPAAVVCLSPWTDMEGAGDTLRAPGRDDPFVSVETVMASAAAYLGGVEPRHPLAAPVHGDLSGLPPLLVQAGTGERLLDDAIMLARAAAAAHVDVTLRCWPEMIHDWQLFWPELEAGELALAEAGAFISRAFAAALPV